MSTAPSRALAPRLALSVGGTFVCSFGYHITVGADVGNGPLFAVQDGLVRHLGVPVGASAIAFGLGFAVLALLLREKVGPSTFAIPLLTGISIAVLEPIAPTFHGLVTRWAMFGIGTAVMVLGAVLSVAAALGPPAIDAAMLALARTGRRSVSHTRIAMECALALVGVVVGGRVGLGTMAMALSVGPLFVFWTGVIDRVMAVEVRGPGQSSSECELVSRS